MFFLLFDVSQRALKQLHLPSGRRQWLKNPSVKKASKKKKKVSEKGAMTSKTGTLHMSKLQKRRPDSFSVLLQIFYIAWKSLLFVMWR